MRLDFCALCGETDSAALEHHHFLPRVMGGSDDETNMFTVCGVCHGKIHAVPRPLCLGDLVKAGQAKANERTAKVWRQVARQKRQQAERATAMAREAQQAVKEAEQAADAKDAEDLTKQVLERAAEKVRQHLPVESPSIEIAAVNPEPQSSIEIAAEKPRQMPLRVIEAISPPPDPPAVVTRRLKPFLGALPEDRALEMHERNGLKWIGYDLCLGGRVIASVDRTNGFRVRMPDGRISGGANLTRIRDACYSWALADLNSIKEAAFSSACRRF